MVVIGGGFSGVTSVKTCLEEGLSVIGFEKTGEVGGLWRFRESDIDGVASVMRSTVIDTSKEMNSFSDFPPPKEFANFMHNSQVLKYLELYAERFKVLPHIKFHHEVLSVLPREDFATTGEWTVKVRNLQNQEEFETIASAVMVGIGHHVYPNVPELPGLSGFTGKVLHSHSYKDFHGFEDKQVVIVGIGNSAMDISVDLSRVSSKVYLSTRRGAWIFSRVGKNGVPFDVDLNNRFESFLAGILPDSVSCYLARKQLNARFDHAKYNLKPKHNPNQQHPSISDELPSRILAGKVTVKNDVYRFTENGVIFKGEEDKVYPVDTVILCTGYQYRFPFLPEEVAPMKNNRLLLYKRLFPTHLSKNTLAIIGLLQPIGSILPASEIQARWAVKVFTGELKLPDKGTMETQIAEMQTCQDNRYVTSPRHTIEVDYVPYMDLIAEEIGAKPDLRNLFLTDPKLWWACFFGPCTPHQYRLQGPHPWPDARQTVLTVWDRINGALDTRHPSLAKESCGCFLSNNIWYIVFAVIALLWFCL